MANTLFVKVLLGLLGALAVICFVLAVSTNLSLRNYRKLQGQLMMASNLQGQMNQLAAAIGSELVEYSKKNPSIDPLLRQYGFKPPLTNAAPATAPQR